MVKKSLSIDLAKKTFHSKEEGEWIGLMQETFSFLIQYMEEKYKDHFYHNAKLYYGIWDTSLLGTRKFIISDLTSDKYWDISIGVTLPKKYIEQFKNNKKRFTFFPLGLIPYFGSRHMTYLLHDKKNNTVEVFDNSGFLNSNMRGVSKEIKDFFKSIFGKSVKFNFETKGCALGGIAVNYCHSREYLYKSGGYCVIFSLWFLEMRLANLGLTKNQIEDKTIKYFKKNPKKLCEALIGYAQFVNALSKGNIIVGDKFSNVIIKRLTEIKEKSPVKKEIDIPGVVISVLITVGILMYTK